MGQPSRLDELRRRVQLDPASIAFAALAEEYRRQGLLGDAIDLCRAGLARHPAYLLGRVTLARALFDSGDTDAAIVEFEQVLRIAPDNLAALRGLAEAHAERGEIGAALERLRAAAAFAPQDAALRARMGELEAALGPAGHRGQAEGSDPPQPGEETEPIPPVPDSGVHDGSGAAAPASCAETRAAGWPGGADTADPPTRGDAPDGPAAAEAHTASTLHRMTASPWSGPPTGAREDGSGNPHGVNELEDDSSAAGPRQSSVLDDVSSMTAEAQRPDPAAVPEAGVPGEEKGPAQPPSAGEASSRTAEIHLLDSVRESEACGSAGLPGGEEAGEPPWEAGRAVGTAASVVWSEFPWHANHGRYQAGDISGDAGGGGRLLALKWPAGAAVPAPSVSVWAEPVEARAPAEVSEEGASDSARGDASAPAVAWAESDRAADVLPPAAGCAEGGEPADGGQLGEAGDTSGDAGDGGRLLALEWPAGTGTREAGQGPAAAEAGERASRTTTPEAGAVSLPSVESALARAPDAAGWEPHGAAFAWDEWPPESAAGPIVLPSPDSTPTRGLSARSGESLAGPVGLEEAVAADTDAWSVADDDDRPDGGMLEQGVAADVPPPLIVADAEPSESAFETAGGTFCVPGAAASSPSAPYPSGRGHQAARGSPWDLSEPGEIARAGATWDLGLPDAPPPPAPEAAGALSPAEIPASTECLAHCGPQPPAAGSGNGPPPVAAPHPDRVASDRRTAALRTLERWLEALERARSVRSCPP